MESTKSGAPAGTRTFVINRPKSIDRRRDFEARAKGTSVSWSYFEAKEALIPGLTYPKVKTERIYRSLTSGEIGCYASHFALWQQLASDESASQYLIFEDDLIVDWNFIERLVQLELSSCGIDYLRLYALRPGRAHLLKRQFFEKRHLVEFRGRAYGCQAYLLTRKGASRLVKCCHEVLRPVDDTMDRYWVHGLRNLALFPFPVIEEFRTSTIGDERTRLQGGSPEAPWGKHMRWLGDRLARRWWLLTHRSDRITRPDF